MNNIKTLINTDLFKGFSNKNIKEILKDKETYIKTYNKNSTIATENAPCDSIGILIDGEIEIIKENASGNLSILRKLHQGHIFGEMAIFSANRQWPATVQVKTTSTVFFIKINAFFKEGKTLTPLREKMVYNMLSILSNRALYLNKRLNYLLEEYNKHHSTQFLTSMNRNALAAFLNITRPSLSRELAHLKDKGILDYSGPSFKIIDLKKLQNILN